MPRPDMTRGLSGTALAINTSAKGYGYVTVQTPLGERHSIRVTTVTGRTKEIALVKHAAYAGEICVRLAAATEELNEAAALIARDRNREEVVPEVIEDASTAYDRDAFWKGRA